MEGGGAPLSQRGGGGGKPPKLALSAPPGYLGSCVPALMNVFFIEGRYAIRLHWQNDQFQASTHASVLENMHAIVSISNINYALHDCSLLHRLHINICHTNIRQSLIKLITKILN